MKAVAKSQCLVRLWSHLRKLELHEQGLVDLNGGGHEDVLG